MNVIPGHGLLSVQPPSVLGRLVRGPHDAIEPRYPQLHFAEEMLRVAQIGIDGGPQGYQRDLAEAKIRKLFPYDLSLGGTLAVNRRTDGSQWCFDGQHRLEAARRSGLVWLPCRVFALSREQEARYFIETNWATLALHARDRFRANVVAGDEQACAIKATIEECGFRVEYEAHSQGAADAVSAVETAQALCHPRRRAPRFDPEPLRATLLLIHAAWPAQPGNATGTMLRAVDAVLRQADRALDTARFVDKLFVYTPSMLNRSGSMLAKTYTVPVWVGVAQKMIDEYNARLPKGGRSALPSLL